MPRPTDTAQPTTDGNLPGGPSPALVRALRQVLRPLVRLMLAQGITYPYLLELLKGLFVEVADKEFRLDARPPTDSRISLVSGVHRKDVSRLRQLLQTARRGRFNVHIDVERLKRFGEQVEHSANRLSIGVVTAALIIGSSIVMTVSGGPTLFGLPLFGLIGFLGAGACGGWLIWSIWRSGGGR